MNMKIKFLYKRFLINDINYLFLLLYYIFISSMIINDGVNV